MSTCAVMLVKDEADVIGYTVEHLLRQVDEVIVSDNGSTDGTREILERLRDGHELPVYEDEADGSVSWVARSTSRVVVLDDPNPAYYQDRKTTALAALALERGHQWVVPCDADEFWYATDGRRVADWLAGLAPDVAIVEAELYNHIPTAWDDPIVCPSCNDDGYVMVPDPLHDGAPMQAQCPFGVRSPFRRIQWRQRNHGALGKVAVRALPGIEIHMGNHSAFVPGGGQTVKGGICVRHYSWRTVEQYVKKIENGARAYAATDMPEGTGTHWRMFGVPPSGEADLAAWRENVADHFRRWFWRYDPSADDSLIRDPAPGA